MKQFVFSPAFVSMTGNLNAGVLLSYLFAQVSDGEDYFETLDSMSANTGLGRRQQILTARDILCKSDFVKCSKKGTPPVHYYKVNAKKIEAELKKYSVDISEYNHFEEQEEPKKPPKKKDKFDDLLSQINEEKRKDFKDIHIKLLRDFYEYRKSIKPIKTAKPLEMYLNELKRIQDAGYKPLEAIELMKSREWQTVKLDWIERESGIEKKDVGNGGKYTW